MRLILSKFKGTFQYQAEPVEQQSLWDRFFFFYWIWDLYDEIMEHRIGQNNHEYYLYSACIILPLILCFRVIRMNRAMFATNVANTHYSIEEKIFTAYRLKRPLKMLR